jgi:hypothetical protein
MTQTLTAAAKRRKKEIAADLRKDLKRLQRKYGTFSDSTLMIREDREDRG